MNERKEKIIKEIKEIAERIEIKLSDYRTKYYKEIPLASRKEIFRGLEKAVSETEILVFYNKDAEFFSYSKIMEVGRKYNTTNIYNYLENAVNGVLKYYEYDFTVSVSHVINSLKNKLIESGYDIDNEFNNLDNRLKISNCITLYEEKYPELVKLQELISIITDIDSIRPGTSIPKIHELYGIKTLLLEFEEIIRIIKTIEDSACVNITLEYIDSLIEWSNFKNIR